MGVAAPVAVSTAVSVAAVATSTSTGLETLLQNVRLAIVQIKNHLAEQTVRPREPMQYSSAVGRTRTLFRRFITHHCLVQSVTLWALILSCISP